MCHPVGLPTAGGTVQVILRAPRPAAVVWEERSGASARQSSGGTLDVIRRWKVSSANIQLDVPLSAPLVSPRDCQLTSGGGCPLQSCRPLFCVRALVYLFSPVSLPMAARNDSGGNDRDGADAVVLVSSLVRQGVVVFSFFASLVRVAPKETKN